MQIDDRMPSIGLGTPTGPPEVLPDPPLEPTRPGEAPADRASAARSAGALERAERS
jgi:hypothetical protein